MLRRSFLSFSAGAAVLAAMPALVRGNPHTPITVYKTPSCGCCAKWAEYLSDNGFDVAVVDRSTLTDTKRRFGVPAHLQSCHTAIVDDYVIEGHVPVNDIRRVLTQRPAISGLSAPGMPSMSPGMNSIEPKGFDVLAFTAEGQVAVFSRY